MRAHLFRGAGLLCLLLVCLPTSAREWVTPVTKMPYPIAPSPANSAYYYWDAYGRLIGPNYYLVPPHAPFNGFLPGPTGQAIMSGNLPHHLLMSKEGMYLGNMPLLGGKKHDHSGAPHSQGPPAPHGGAPMQGPMPYPMMPGAMPYPMMPGAMPYPMMPGAMPYPPRPAPMPYTMMPAYGNPMARPGMQMPYMNLPTSPYAQQPAYYQPAPPPMMMVPMAMPSGMMPGARPMTGYGAAAPQANAYPDPRMGVWPAQNVTPGPGGAPFMPIPGFTSPAIPPMPAPPGGGMAPVDPFQAFGPVSQFEQFNRLQGPQPPRMEWTPMQMPRMDMVGPPPARPGGGMYPTHPFTRSPRDFFMWGESMEDERARGNRPLPVP